MRPFLVLMSDAESRSVRHGEDKHVNGPRDRRSDAGALHRQPWGGGAAPAAERRSRPASRRGLARSRLLHHRICISRVTHYARTCFYFTFSFLIFPFFFSPNEHYVHSTSTDAAHTIMNAIAASEPASSHVCADSFN